MELLQVFAEVYVDASYALGIIATNPNGLTPERMGDYAVRMQGLQAQCKTAGLKVTSDALCVFIDFLQTASLLDTPLAMQFATHQAQTIMQTLKSELSHRVLFQIRSEVSELFANPTEGWKEVIDRFPETQSDIEESARCFALSRYAASVFHSVQIVESGLLQLGTFLGVKDPLSGWTAVANELKKTINKKYGDKTAFEKQHVQFIEQMQGCVEALKTAWRNKISHAQGKLTLMTSDFVPDVAEEIRIATRAFMRRLATEMPIDE